MNTTIEDRGRFLMWLHVFDELGKYDEYLEANRNKKNKMKREYALDYGKSPGEFFPSEVMRKQLASLVNNEGECDMHTNNSLNIEAAMTPTDEAVAMRQYLRGRMYDVIGKKVTEAECNFGLIDDESPRSPEEIVERIKSGMFVIPAPEGRDNWGSPYKMILWRDPAKVKDRDGYNAWSAKLDVARTKLEDTIAINSPADALSELQAFEATVH